MTEPNRTEMLNMLPPPDTTSRKAVAISCGLLVLVMVAWTSVCAGLLSVGSFVADPVLAVFSGLSAVALAIPYGLVILWLDRNEKEPPLLMLSAFLWGAVIATMISYILNTTAGVMISGVVTNAQIANQLTASFSAPLVEETAKGAAMIALYLMFRHHLDNVLDGVVYGALVGLGFAVFENFIYYVNTGSLSGALQLVCIRGVITSPGTHACFTAITGASIGMFRVMRSGVMRWFLPPAGLATAMFVHFSWNTFTAFFVTDSFIGNLVYGLPMAVVVLQAPFVMLVLLVSGLALWHETSLIERFLKSERPPVLHDDELSSLIPARRRSLKSMRLLLTGQLRGWWLVRRRNALLIELAFEKWHMDAEAALGDTSARVHAGRVVEIRKELGAMAAPPA